MTDAQPESLHCACRPGDESLLLGELGRVYPHSVHKTIWSGWTESRLEPDDREGGRCLALAQQALPDAAVIRAPSIARLALAAAPRIVAALEDHDGPWRLHAFCVDQPGADARQVRCDRIAAQVLDFLGKKQRRLLRTRIDDPAALWSPEEALVQIALIEPDRLLLCVVPAVAAHPLRRSLSRWPGGQAPIDEDKTPPSRAYRKLLEAELHLGLAIGRGDRVVDLGAAPGGWSYVALERGAVVTAVDRSPLRDDLMRHPSLDFRKGDGFKYEPEYPPVDWLLCDVIAYPVRTVELVSRWIGRGLCRSFVVSVKFQGEDEYPRLEELKQILADANLEFQIRRLRHNRNEVTALGAPAGRPTGAT